MVYPFRIIDRISRHLLHACAVKLSRKKTTNLSQIDVLAPGPSGKLLKEPPFFPKHLGFDPAEPEAKLP